MLGTRCWRTRHPDGGASCVVFCCFCFGGLSVQGFRGFRVWGSGLRIQGFGFRFVELCL